MRKNIVIALLGMALWEGVASAGPKPPKPVWVDEETIREANNYPRLIPAHWECRPVKDWVVDWTNPTTGQFDSSGGPFCTSREESRKRAKLAEEAEMQKLNMEGK